MLGIAVGGMTAISSFVRAGELAPLPYRDAQPLFNVSSYQSFTPQPHEGVRVDWS
jgi:hypothetical protein